jgi:alkyl hydroperoxide reductase subunit AhpC
MSGVPDPPAGRWVNRSKRPPRRQLHQKRRRCKIDPDGVIQGYEVLTPPVGRNIQETLRQVQAFQLVRETKGAEATPSGWRPGKMTLKPGPNLVGNVWKEWKTEMAFD